MSSRVNKSALEPRQINKKTLKSAISKEYYDPPDDKQFIAFSMILKESNSGFQQHERLLLFDSKTKSLRYFKQLPNELPKPSEELPEGKQTIFTKKTRYFSFKSTKTNIGKAKVEWIDLNGKKSIWQIAFSSNQILNQWVLMVNQALKDGHLKPENRPKSHTRRQSRVNVSKYMTQFMKQSKRGEQSNDKRDSSRESSSSKIPFWAKNLKQSEINANSKNDGEWLLSKVAEKQRQINQNLKKRQQQQLQKQKQHKLQQQSRLKIQEQGQVNSPKETKPKNREQQFFNRKSVMIPNKKMEIEKIHEPAISREEQFRKKLIEKAIEKNRIESSSSNGQSRGYREYTTIQTENIKQSVKPKRQEANGYSQSELKADNPKIEDLRKQQNVHNSEIHHSKRQADLLQKIKEGEKQGAPKQTVEKMPQKQTVKEPQQPNQQTVPKIIITQPQKHQHSHPQEQLDSVIPSNFRYSTPQNNTNQNSKLNKNSDEQQFKFRQRVRTVANQPDNLVYSNTNRYETHFKNQYANHPYIQAEHHYPGIMNSVTSYSNYIQKCKQVSELLVEKVNEIVSEAKRDPTPKLNISRVDPSSSEINLHIEKQYIEYAIPLQMNQQQVSPLRSIIYNWYAAALKMEQYTSIIKYIKQMIKRGKLFKYGNNCIIIPYCIVSYKWNLVYCKSTIPSSFHRASLEESAEIDELLQVPEGTWDYYLLQNKAKATFLLVDYAVQTLEIQSDLPIEAIDQLSSRLYRQDVVCSCIADLSEQFSFTYSAALNQQIICELLRKLNERFLQRSFKQKNNSNNCLSQLYSMLYGLKCGQYIQKMLTKHMLDMEPGQLYENIDQMIKLALSKKLKDQQYSNHLHMAIIDTYRQFLQGQKIRYPEEQQIVSNIVLTTILHTLGLRIVYREQWQGQMNSQQKWFADQYQQNSYGSKYVLEFHTEVYHIGIQSFDEYMDQTKKILIHQFKVEDEEGKYLQYLQLQNLLKHHASEEDKKQSTSLPPTTKTQLYLNLNPRILLFKSIYTTTMTIKPPKSESYCDIIWMQPPNRYSYLLGINCTKWAIKNNKISHYVILQLLKQQIKNCKLWAGANNYYLMLYYELISLYCCSIADYDTSIEYTKETLQLFTYNYGDHSYQAIQKWYQLANIQLQAELFQHSLHSYKRSLELLLNSDGQSTYSSRSSLFSQSDQIGEATKLAEVQLRAKISQILLAIGKIQECLHQSMACLKLNQQISSYDKDSQKQLSIMFRIIKCYEINRNSKKLKQIIEVVGYKFPSYILQSQNYHEVQPEHQIQSKILKMCLYPYLQHSNQFDSNRCEFFNQTISSIQKQYRNRYSDHEYQLYLSKWIHNYHQGEQSRRIVPSYLKSDQPNIFLKIHQLLIMAPIFDVMSPKTGVKYSLYSQDDQMLHSFSPSRQKERKQKNEKLIQTFRILQVLGHLVGFSYLKNCFNK